MTQADKPVAARRRDRARVRPLPGADHVAGVTHDGQRVWAATGATLRRLRPGERRRPRARSTVAGDAGTAFDGKLPLPDRRGAHRQDRSRHRRGAGVDPGARPGRATRASPGPRAACGSGSTATARSTRSTPQTGTILRTIESNRFVTGVTWVDGELWHGTWEGDESEHPPRRPAAAARCSSGWRCRRARASAASSPTAPTSSTAAAATSGKVRAVRRPKRKGAER